MRLSELSDEAISIQFKLEPQEIIIIISTHSLHAYIVSEIKNFALSGTTAEYSNYTTTHTEHAVIRVLGSQAKFSDF